MSNEWLKKQVETKLEHTTYGEIVERLQRNPHLEFALIVDRLHDLIEVAAQCVSSITNDQLEAYLEQGGVTFLLKDGQPRSEQCVGADEYEDWQTVRAIMVPPGLIVQLD